MKIKVGTKLNEIIVQSGFRKKHIAEKMGITTQWLTKITKSDEVDEDLIQKIGDIIQYDFSKDFKKMNQKVTITKDVESKLDDLLELNSKSFALMAKQFELMEKLLSKK